MCIKKASIPRSILEIFEDNLRRTILQHLGSICTAGSSEPRGLDYL
jgi:hypothetical protein